jgi:hypothetical protein
MKASDWRLRELRQAQAAGRRRYLQRLASSIRGQVRRALLDRDKTPDRYKAAIGCTYRELAVHIERQFEPGMTWKNMGKWHVDHIVPVAHFLEHDPDGVMWNHYTNLQPLWAKDNLSKGAKL